MSENLTLRHPGETGYAIFSGSGTTMEPTHPMKSPGELPWEAAMSVASMTSEAVVAVDGTGRVVFFNGAAETLFCRRADGVLGGAFRALVPDSAADDPAWSDGGRVEVPRPDGTTVVAEVRAERVTAASGGLTLYLLLDRGVESRAAEELRLLQTMTLAIGEAPDLRTAMRLAMQMLGEFTGWTAGEAWLPDAASARLRRGPTWSAGSGFEAFHAASEAVTFARGEGLPGRVWASGRPAWISDVATDPEFVRGSLAHAAGLRTGIAIPVLAANEVVAVVAFYHTGVRARDAELTSLISTVAAQLGTLIQRRQTEEALARHAEELARSNAELEQFAYVASHDLQEPLRMVASYTQLLAKRYGPGLDGDAHEFIGYAVEGVTRMQQLIHDLLMLSRVGTRGEAFVATSTHEILGRVLRDIEPVVEECAALVTSDPLPVVAADPAQLYQVFQNLLVNALKFRGAEPPRVHLSARADGDEWVFSVRDNGIGIAPEYFPRIWSIFQRLHSRAEYPGTGIGLSICKKIVERHGGRIWVDSAPGAGSTFSFSLPAREADAGAAA